METDEKQTENEAVAEVLEVPPRDYAVRAFSVIDTDGEQLRAASVRDENDQPVMFGHLSVFGEWARVDSRVEGQFMERVAPGAFKNTINTNRSRMRSIYDHGQDSRYGRDPLGPIRELQEDQRGVYYEVPLVETPLISGELVPRLRAGLYGTSYRFRTVKMDPPVRPRHETEHNPDRWEERTIRELEMVEFGPTPFPVYSGPTAGIRSFTDEFRQRQLGIDPEQWQALLTAIALPTVGAGESHSAEGSRAVEVVPSVTPTPKRFRSREEYLTWLSRS